MSTGEDSGALSPPRLACIGECMIEWTGQNDLSAGRLAYGGDVLNTAVYASRMGAEVRFVSALGSDPYSEALLRQWQSEGVECRVAKFEDALPGLYSVALDNAGERSFHYWRRGSAAARFFSDPGSAAELESGLKGVTHVLVSMITLAIAGSAGRARLIDLLAAAKRNGCEIIVDANYRAALWPGQASARSCFEQILGTCSLLLPSFDDLAALFAESAKARILDRVRASLAEGAECVVTDGAADTMTLLGDQWHAITPPRGATVVDTTAAGDAFNAGFIVARQQGLSPKACVRVGQKLAGIVLAHRGAIVPLREFQTALHAG